jgi:VWFA-related protein
MSASRTRWSRIGLALLLALSQVLVLTRPALAADPLLVINQVLLDGFPEVTVYFTAVDGEGLPMTDVERDRLQVIHNGRSLPEFDLSLVNIEQEGLALVLAIDVSGSMKGKPLDDARASANIFLDRMGPRDRIALIAFNQKVQVVQELTDDRGALERALNSLYAEGDTAVYDAVFQAATMAAGQPLGRRAVVIITDGEDTKSSLTLDDAIAKAREGSTPVSVIGLGDVKPDALRRIALTTGGSFGIAPDSDQLAGRIEQVSDLLRKQYVLHYQAPDSRQPDNEVEVVLSQAGRQIRSAQRFAAPPMPALDVNLADLAPGTTVRGLVVLRPTFVNARRVDRVEFLVDGASVQSVTQPPFEFAWDTAKLVPGEHTLTVRARLGDQEAQQDLKLAVAPAIQVAIKGPTGQDVTGKVKLTADVDAAAPAAGVDWAVDGQPIGSVQQPPYEVEWDSTGAAPGDHVVTADARDERGNVARASQTLRIVPVVPAAATPGPTVAPTVAATAGATAAPTTAGAATATTAATSTPSGSRSLGGLASNWWAVPALVLGVIAILGLLTFVRSRRRNAVIVSPVTSSVSTPIRMLPDRDERRTSAGSGRQDRPTTGVDVGRGGYGSDDTWNDAAPPVLDHFDDSTRAASDRFDEGSAFHEAPTVLMGGFDTAPDNRTPLPGELGHATLTVSVPGLGTQSWHLGPEQVLGRVEGPDVIVVKDTLVSRRHARITWEHGQFVYRDLGSTNPTLRNGRPIPDPCILADGDRLNVGRAELVFRA